MILRATATAALAISLITAGGTIHGAARPNGLREAALVGAMLAAGEVGPRSSVPWRLVGPGWVLAQYSPGTTRPTTLYLVDPRGGRYALYTWPASKPAPRLFAWSGDKARALFSADYPSTQTSQIVLATGHVEKIGLPAAQNPIGYTMPDGLNLLAADIPASGPDKILRYNLAGQLQKVLASGRDFDTAVDNPDGATLAVSGDRGLELVSNLGGVIRTLPVSGAQNCGPIRWWASGTILARCVSGINKSRLWLVPASGAAPAALTPTRGSRGIDLGDLGAWRLRSGLYLEAAGACGTIFIARQASNGSVTQVNVPGTLNLDNYVLAADGARLLVNARTWTGPAPCGSSPSLLWFNPATRAEQWLFKSPKRAEGVIAALAYGRPNG